MSQALHHRRQKRKPTALESVGTSHATTDTSKPDIGSRNNFQTPDHDTQAANTESNPSFQAKLSLAKAFLSRHSSSPSLPQSTLTNIVIIPQRRPKTRSRGFIHAYSPVLSQIGIDQATFNASLKPNEWLYAMNLAGLSEIAVPEPMMLLVLGWDCDGCCH